MRVPRITGTIDRRILANYRVDPATLARLLPAPFRPQLVENHAVAGICLIRLKHVRPSAMPGGWGLTSENAAHRFAVEWDTSEGTRSGVFIPRRDTNSALNALVGGRLFPGVHHRAHFEVRESENYYDVSMLANDRSARLRVAGQPYDGWPDGSLFRNATAASDFFRGGALGYSPARKAGVYDGLELSCRTWVTRALAVDTCESSFFEDRSLFPRGSVQFDNALLMIEIEHEWLGREMLSGSAPTANRA
ncbi:MAG: DUF2071 domain-containing protein [Spirochaetales bacterium]|nr:DUF2071 domain-containing protein [Leptospiraceae bacterium]MCP5480049.1 DUF2071 domain-containing protein [Spirochaetales bacterium]MCP5485610.1 DUF2071 domain-containing protein [Spirochaetales bacterium]